MKLGRVVGNVVSTIKHDSYQARTLLLVEPVTPDGVAEGPAKVCIDYVGAGVGELVIMGGAPGVAKTVFDLKIAPIKDLVMGIIDEVEYNGNVTMRASDSGPSKTK